MVPLPPVNRTPPRTEAAIASDSYPVASSGCPEYILAAKMIPAIAAQHPEMIYALILTLLILTPANLAASTFPPTA